MRSLNLPTTILLIATSVCVLSVPSAFKRKNDKATSMSTHGRGLHQFAMMISCATNRSGWDYYDYGCFCGYGGSGAPVDQTDRCCYIHDSCYDFLVVNNICSAWWMPYYVSYLYTGCHKCGKNLHHMPYYVSYLYTGCHKCEPVSSYPLDDKDAVCKKGLCDCDSRAVQCFAKARFNPSNVDYDTSKC